MTSFYKRQTLSSYVVFLLATLVFATSAKAQNTIVTTIAGGSRTVDSTYLASQFRSCFGVVRNPNNGDIYVADERNFTIRLLKGGQVYTLAGSPTRQSGTTDGRFTGVRFTGPRAICLNPTADTLYIADGSGNRDSRVRALVVVGPDSGTVFTLAGAVGSNPNPRNGIRGDLARLNQPGGLIYINGGLIYAEDASFTDSKLRIISLRNPYPVGTLGDSGVATSYGRGISIQGASGLALAGISGDSLFVASSGKNKIYKVSLVNAGKDSIAGTGASSLTNGNFGSATFWKPRGLAYDRAARLLYVSEESNQDIRILNFNTHQVSTLTGIGPNSGAFLDSTRNAARFNRPVFISLVDSLLLVGDYYNARVRVVSIATGRVRTLAGSRAFIDGPTSLNVFEGGGIGYYKNGTYLIADQNTHSLRLLNPATATVRTLAGNGVAGTSADVSTLAAARLSSPGDVAVKGDTALVADYGNDRIVLFDLAHSQAKAINNVVNVRKLVYVSDTLMIAIATGDNKIYKCNLSTGTVRLLAGSGGNRTTNGRGDTAQIRQPADGAIWHDTLYVTSGSGSGGPFCVRAIALAGPNFGYVSTRYADNNQGLQLNNPADLVVDDSGMLYISDQAYGKGVQRISLVDNHRPSIPKYFAGLGAADDGPVAQVRSGHILNICIDSSRNALLAVDAENGVIRKISPLYNAPMSVAEYTRHNWSLSLLQNPAHGTIAATILGQIGQPWQALLYNVLGVQVAAVHGLIAEGRADLQIPIQKQPKGVYFLKAYLNGATQTRRVVVE